MQQDTNKKEKLEDIGHINQLIKDDPGSAISEAPELCEYLLVSDSEVRKSAIDAVVDLSSRAPVELKKIIPIIKSRIDDVEAHVRAGALQASYHLAQWHPQEFADATNLIVSSLEPPNHQEQAFAFLTLCQIAIQRPDIVTPQDAALNKIKGLKTKEEFKNKVRKYKSEIDYWDYDNLADEAIVALKGGDMASRSVESDLVPVSKSTSISKPARITAMSATCGIFTIFGVYILIIVAIRMIYKHGGSGVPGLKRDLNPKKLKFLKSLPRALLYLRSSNWPTPAEMIPVLPNETPTSEDMYVESPELPDGWKKLAKLVRLRDKYQCRNCGRGGGPEGNAELHVDHQIPRSKDGSNDPRNLRTLCRECHEARHARTFE